MLIGTTVWEQHERRTQLARFLRDMRVSVRRGDVYAAHENFGMARGYAIRAGIGLRASTYLWTIGRLHPL